MEDWITVKPEIVVPGTNKIEISARPHTGRHERSTVLKFTNNSVSDRVELLHVTQLASDEYVTFCGIKEIVLEPEETDIIVYGVTNSSRLTFAVGTGNLNIELPEEYNAGGEMNKNGDLIKYDPGRHDEFGFRLALHIPENEQSENRQNVLIAKADNGKQVCISIVQTCHTEAAACSLERAQCPHFPCTL